MLSELVTAGYRDCKPIHRDAVSELYLAVDERTAQKVVLKCFVAEASEQSARREHEALSACVHRAIPRAIRLEHVRERPLLVLEHVPGVTLEAWSRAQLPSLQDFLEVAGQVADALACVHAARIVHGAVTPAHVVVDPETRETHLVGFGRACRLGEGWQARAPESRGGALRYIAPEQTGRVNRAPDFRTDLYALGATLYCALTGRPPFGDVSSVALIQAHVARTPVSPGTLRPRVPEALADALMKLLRKEPDERYQSAAGLLADLRGLAQVLDDPAALERFKLAADEGLDRPRFARTLFGRDREQQALEDAFTAAAAGELRCLLVTGPAGAGKSCLVNAARPSLSARGACVIEARFERGLQRPCSGWGRALDSLAHQMLTESDALRAEWRRRLREGLGGVAGALIPLAPSLEAILGEVDPAPELDAAATQARLVLAMQRLLRACALPERPLVLFLEDLHWSDPDSWALLEGVLASVDLGALLVVAAYQGAEDGVEGPVDALFERLAASRGVAFERLWIGPLARPAAEAMLAEALRCTPAAVRLLADHVERKTGNLPRAVHQLIEQLHMQGLLRYEGGRWRWDERQIGSAAVAQGAVEWITRKVERLDAGVRRVLECASCAGEHFDRSDLVDLGSAAGAEVDAALVRLIQEGLIVSDSEGFRFAHDRIRQAARELLSEEEQARLHYEVGRVQLARDPRGEGARLFEIADHLNRGARFLPEEMRIPLIELDVKAARRSLAAGTSTNALAFLKAAQALFTEADWRAHRALGFELTQLAAETALHSNQRELALELLNGLEARKPDPLAFARMAATRVRILGLERSAVEAASYALEALRKLGVHWVLHPSRLRIWLSLQYLRWNLRRRLESALLMTHGAAPERIQAILHLASVSGMVRGRVDANSGVLSTCFALQQFLRFGPLPGTTLYLAIYAGQLQSLLASGREGERFATLALVRSQYAPAEVESLKAQYYVHAFVQPWILPRRVALAPMDAVAEKLREAGEGEHAYYASFMAAVFRALGGEATGPASERLLDVVREVRSRRFGYPEPEDCHSAYALLTAAELRPEQLEEESRRLDERLRGAEGQRGVFARTLLLLVLCVHGRHDLVLRHSDAIKSTLRSGTSYGIHVADHLFYRALACAASLGGKWRRGHPSARDLERCRARLARWERSGPDFPHMLLFLDAEIARLRTRLSEAAATYLSSASRATQQGFLHHAALAQERLADLHLTLHHTSEAQRALREAIDLYTTWNVPTKTTELQKRLREL